MNLVVPGFYVIDVNPSDLRLRCLSLSESKDRLASTSVTKLYLYLEGPTMSSRILVENLYLVM